MKSSQAQTLNMIEFAENAFSDEVNIDIEGKPSTKFNCNLCDFKNANRGGMKRHIHASHRLGGLKRQEHDDTQDGEGEDKKTRIDDFHPDWTSTKAPMKGPMRRQWMKLWQLKPSMI
eukprot:GFUD01139114.1.p1 GENE.GFUD01139114.1~~GFUD01139114.1.p1  ORF type:complete len:117 (+),score=13.45 GFUD01139114.1:75-425(+)